MKNINFSFALAFLLAARVAFAAPVEMVPQAPTDIATWDALPRDTCVRSSGITFMERSYLSTSTKAASSPSKMVRRIVTFSTPETGVFYERHSDWTVTPARDDIYLKQGQKWMRYDLAAQLLPEFSYAEHDVLFNALNVPPNSDCRKKK